MTGAAHAADTDRGVPKQWGHRTVPPTETLDRLRPHFRRMGITRLADITGLDRPGIPVFQAIRPMGLSLSVAQGKGLTPEAAATSAAMEAAEGWHAETAPLAMWRGALSELAHHYPADWLPLRETPPPNTPLTLVESRDLLGGAAVPVPADLVHKDYTRPAEHRGLCRSTNGLASGNTLAEALASALHEVIERDAAAGFAQSPPRARRPIALRDARCGSPEIDRLVIRLHDAGLKLWLHDITSDLGVTAVQATIAETGRDSRGPGHIRGAHVGHGCHLDPVTALVRAITEAAQSRLTDIAGSRDDLDAGRYQPARFQNIDRLLGEAVARLDRPTPPFDRPDLSGHSAEADVGLLCARLAAAGLPRVLWVDLSRPDMPVRVVRVIVPGLGFLDGHNPRGGARTRAGQP